MRTRISRRLPFHSALVPLFVLCAPLTRAEADPAARSSVAAARVPKTRAGMVFVRGGTFTMGTNAGLEDEGPEHSVAVHSFWMDRTEVTVAAFAQFVNATGYITESEKVGSSGVFSLTAHGWQKVTGANWRHPAGPTSTARADEPVTQVSWNDATAYARWAGKRLPTEAEWEYAARGGLERKPFSWGDSLRPTGRPVANWWQGKFPDRNTVEDGFLGVALVAHFPPNGFGLYDMTGNVWEWGADWYSDEYYAESPAQDPRGPAQGLERVMRGGSFLCAENHCTRFRVAGRSKAMADTALNNVGFRCVASSR